MTASASNPRPLRKEKLKLSRKHAYKIECIKLKKSIRRRRLVRGVETSGREERLRFLGKKRRMSLKTTEPRTQVQNHCTFFFIIVFRSELLLRLPLPLPLGFSEEDQNELLLRWFCFCFFFFLSEVNRKLQSSEAHLVYSIRFFFS